ncbi:MAG: type II toxin-antitoxin system PemK/MazF family toxin [Patescibacteria group bacterium]
MDKEFQKWHSKKEKLHNEALRLFFHEREVWWCSLGVNIGFEQDGKGVIFSRPILVLKKFNNEVFWALSLTTKIKQGKFYAPVILNDNVPRCVIVSQLRLIDAKRLIDKIGTIGKENYNQIKKTTINLFDS